VALQPDAGIVVPGATFDVYLRVTQAGSAFNGFDAIVGYDPAALTPIPLAPISLQEGALMKNACGSRFHRFRASGDRDSVTLVLLCNGVTVAGTGDLYRFRFQASNTPQLAHLTFLPGLKFYDAGVAVLPVTATGATVQIGPNVDVEEGFLAVRAPSMRVVPNPSGAMTRFMIRTPAFAGVDVQIFDIGGRLVRRFERPGAASGQIELVWDGQSDDGGRVSPGLYLARLGAAGGQETRARIIRLE
jgi:hypothetical protein